MAEKGVRRMTGGKGWIDPESGLSDAQVQQRVQAGKVNRDASVPTKSIGRIIRDNACTLFNLINAVLAMAVLLVGSYKNLLFLGVVFCNLIIGTVQEIRAKRTVDKLSLLSAAGAQVIRGGKKQTVPLDEVVLDDILELSSGGQIAADCVIRSGECEVNESLVTGEADPIHKTVGDTLLSGSYLVSGRCRAQVEHVGTDNYIATISAGAKQLKRAQSAIMDALNRIIRFVSIMIIPVGALLFLKQLSIDGNTLQQAVVSTTAALIGMIPEGLVLLTSSVLAVSVIRLSRHRVLVQELYCIEALARVDVLCLDKTGTITEGRMELHDVVPLGNACRAQAEQALGALACAQEDGGPTMDAVRRRYPSSSGWAAVQTVPFSSEKKWSGASFAGHGTYVLGAPEFVLRGNIGGIEPEMARYTRENRVLLLAYADGGFVGRGLPEGLCPLALILIRDVIRPQAPDTLRYFADQGVGLKVISGDNMHTVSAIARRAGLEGADRCVDASTLKTEEELAEAAERYTVFGRVSPMQKQQLVRALKAQGHTVAMTGDGVNDVLALREADCSVAMASGSDAARNVAQLVLLDSRFDAMPRVVAEGRRTINNIQRSASLFLVKTIYATLLAVLFLLIPLPYPFMPIQLTLTSVFTIGIPSFVLALEPNRERVKGDFLRNVISKAVPGAVTIVFNVLVVSAAAFLLDIPQQQMSTMCVMLTGFTGFLLVFRICLPFNPLRVALFGFIVGGFTLCVIFLHGLFSLVPLPLMQLIALLICAVGAFVVLSGMLYLFEHMGKKKERTNDK